MAEKPGAETGALARSLDQPGQIGEHEFGLVVDAHDAELRMQGRERVVGDFRPGVRQARQQRRFAGIRQADETGIGDQLQTQPHPELRARASPDRRGAAPGWSNSCNAYCRSRRRRRAAARPADPAVSDRRARFPCRRRAPASRPPGAQAPTSPAAAVAPSQGYIGPKPGELGAWQEKQTQTVRPSEAYVGPKPGEQGAWQEKQTAPVGKSPDRIGRPAPELTGAIPSKNRPVAASAGLFCVRDHGAVAIRNMRRNGNSVLPSRRGG